MIKFKPWLWSFSLILLFIATVVLMRFQSEQTDPCIVQSRTQLAETYPALAELLQRQRFESSQLLARQREQDFMINLEMSSEQLDLEDALKMSTQQIEAVAALRQGHSEAFTALCRELVAP